MSYHFLFRPGLWKHVCAISFVVSVTTFGIKANVHANSLSQLLSLGPKMAKAANDDSNNAASLFSDILFVKETKTQVFLPVTMR